MGRAECAAWARGTLAGVRPPQPAFTPLLLIARARGLPGAPLCALSFSSSAFCVGSQGIAPTASSASSHAACARWPLSANRTWRLQAVPAYLHTGAGQPAVCRPIHTSSIPPPAASWSLMNHHPGQAPSCTAPASPIALLIAAAHGAAALCEPSRTPPCLGRDGPLAMPN